MPDQLDLPQGTLDLLILRTLARRPEQLKIGTETWQEVTAAVAHAG